MKNNGIKILTLCVAVLLLGCSKNSELTGGGAETGNGDAVSGFVYDKTNKPISSTSVYFIPIEYNPAGNLNEQKLYESKTDSNGYFKIQPLDSGRYNVLIYNEDTTQGVLIQSIQKKPGVPDTLDFVLSPLSTISFPIESFDNNFPGLMYIPGTILSLVIDSNSVNDDYVKLVGLPSGDYSNILYRNSHLDTVQLINKTVSIHDQDKIIDRQFSWKYWVGQVRNPNNQVLSNATVNIYNWDYNSISPKATDTLLSLKTDSTGLFRVYNNLDSGIYNLYAFNIEGSRGVLIKNVTDGLTEQDTITVRVNDLSKIFIPVPSFRGVLPGKMIVPGISGFQSLDQSKIINNSVPLNSLPQMEYDQIWFISILGDTVNLLVNSLRLERDTSLPLYYSWMRSKSFELQNVSELQGQTFSNYPIKVYLDSSALGQSLNSIDSNSVRILNMDGITPLNFEIDNWDTTNSELILWVKMDSISFSTGLNPFTLYWDNNLINDASSSQVFDTKDDYILTWHMDPSQENFNGRILDHTQNNLSLISQVNLESSNFSTGEIGEALKLDGDSIWFMADSSVLLDNLPLADFSICVWFKSDSSDGKLLSKRTNMGWDFGLEPSGRDSRLSLYAHFEGQDLHFSSLDNSIIRGNWYYGCVEYEKNIKSATLYINGETAPLLISELGIGNYKTDDSLRFTLGTSISGNRRFKGEIDEVRVSKRVRGQSWIRANYLTQSRDTFPGLP